MNTTAVLILAVLIGASSESFRKVCVYMICFMVVFVAWLVLGTLNLLFNGFLFIEKSVKNLAGPYCSVNKKREN